MGDHRSGKCVEEEEEVGKQVGSTWARGRALAGFIWEGMLVGDRNGRNRWELLGQEAEH
jgi:hypothetical protein